MSKTARNYTRDLSNGFTGGIFPLSNGLTGGIPTELFKLSTLTKVQLSKLHLRLKAYDNCIASESKPSLSVFSFFIPQKALIAAFCLIGFDLKHIPINLP